MPRTGEVGEQIYEQVEQLVSQEGLNRQQAFARISEETGRRAGTVAANYYRVARKRSGGTQTRRARRTTATTGRSRSSTARRAATSRGRSSGGGDVDALATALVANIEALVSALRTQAQEVSELRERLDGARAALGDGAAQTTTTTRRTAATGNGRRTRRRTTTRRARSAS